MGVLDSPPGGGVLSSAPAPKPPAPALPGAGPGDMREFADVGATRRAIYANVLDAARGIEPVQNARHTLQLADVDWADPDEPTVKSRKRAILRGETLSRRLRGTWRLLDNATGQVVDERKSTLASVPVMTNGGTFVLNGTEYTLANQMRLRPGVFTRVKHNGEVESHVNILPGRGVSHRYTLDPERSTFKVSFGQSAVPLLPVLRALGASDRQVREAWGDDVFAANAQAADPKAVDKLVKRLVKNVGDGPDNRRAALAKALTDMPLDPEVTRRTLGQSFDRLGVDSILASTRRVLQVHRREADPDDRDALAYQQLLGPEDLFAERVRGAARVLRPALWKASFKGNLSPLGANFLDRHVRAAITASGLGQPLEEVNPADLLGQITRVSRLGEGGIPSIDSVPEEARNVQPSHYGFVDPLLTPESFKVGVDSRLAGGTRKGRDGRVYARFRDPKTGEAVWKTPQEVADLTVAFPGELARGSKHVYAIRGGRLDNVRRRDVDLVVPDAEGVFNPLANMIPLKAGTKGQRVMMGARMLTQALPLAAPEAPWVQSGMPDHDDRSFEEEYGRHMGAIRGDLKGRVVSVTPDEIVVQAPTGETRTVELHNNLPFNRKTFLHNTPVVRPGDPVEPGQLLARSNYTDDKGATALGLNLRTAYIPYRGMNFEDAVVISQAAAKRLSSEHMYQHDTEWEEGVKRGKRTFLSLFPTQFDRKTLDTMDDDGIVKPGTRVEDGHPLVLQAKVRDRAHNQIVRGKDSGFTDGTLTWDHHDPGVVTDVEKTDKGVVVTVKSMSEMKVGDKLSGRYGDKGVIAHIVPDEEMPRGPDGKAYEVLVNPLGVITRCYDDQTEFLTSSGWKFGNEVARTDWLACYDPAAGSVELLPQLGFMHVTDYSGPMVSYRSKVLDFCVTPNHKMWACGDWPGAGWGEYRADQLVGKRYRLPVAAEPTPTTIYGGDKFSLPTVPRNGVKDTAWSDDPIEIAAGDWAEFLGWYVAEGNTTWDERTGEYKVHVSQSDTAKPLHQRRIADLLNRLPFEWNYNSTNIQFHVSSKRLAAYLRPLGLGHEKYVPDWVFDQAPEVRARFLESYWFGDGSVREGATGTVSQASTTSRRLADDLHRLLVLQGESGAVYPKNEKAGYRPAWYVSRHLVRHRTTAVDGWRETQYAGKIYCPTVPTGYVVTRRNGKLLLAGNTNPGQVVEAALGKVAAATGKRYAVKDFDSARNMVEFARAELKRHGLSDLEDAEDPATQRKIPKVLAGSRFFMKLHHTSESKGQGRGIGGYTNEEAPAKGGEFGSKRVSLMDINALLSHGAHEVLRDAGAIRGQKNQDYWAAFMSGKTPPDPRVPMVYRKFMNQLRAAGINPAARGDRTQIMALTDRDVDELAAGREITSADTVDWKEGLKPIPGGLFDPTLTGGHNGNRWSYIKLHEPLPNPVMEEPIRRVLGLTAKRFEQVLAGREELNGLRGPLAVASALGRIDLDKGIAAAKAEFRTGKRAARDQAVRKWTLLEHAKRLGLHPRDWVLSRVPVIPPAFRPVSVMGATGRPMVADPNYLYKELFDANQQLRDMSGLVDDVGDERLTAYRAFKAVTGLGDPTNPKNVERKVKGVLKYVFGDNPKFGVVQRKLLGSTVDTVGRAVITPNPDLDMDTVGLPETKAWEIYKPFVVRRLARRGVPPLRAAELVKARDKMALAALQDEMDDRPVIVTRAPVLHRYGTMAFRPRLVKGETLQVPPLIVKGFAADFDGDAMNYHVPVSDGAVKDALEKMLPSKNLLAVKNFRVHQLPQNEYQGGLYQASADRSDKPERYFDTKADMLRAVRRGEIAHDQPVVILNDR